MNRFGIRKVKKIDFLKSLESKNILFKQSIECFKNKSNFGPMNQSAQSTRFYFLNSKLHFLTKGLKICKKKLTHFIHLRKI